LHRGAFENYGRLFWDINKTARKALVPVAFVTGSIRPAEAAAAAGQLVRVCIYDCIGYAYSIACARVSAHSNDAIGFQDSNVYTTGRSKISIISSSNILHSVLPVSR